MESLTLKGLAHMMILLIKEIICRRLLKFVLYTAR